MCDMTQSYEGHERFKRVTHSFVTRLCQRAPWPIHMRNTTCSHVLHDWFIQSAPWPIHMRDTAYSHVWHDLSIRATEQDNWPRVWLNVAPFSCSVARMNESCTRSHAWHNLFARVTRLIHTCDRTRELSYIESFIRPTKQDNWPRVWFNIAQFSCSVARLNESCHSSMILRIRNQKITSSFACFLFFS